ncbi:MAG: hypothetical protein DI535_20715 [Citrobacter freundii]|nr:MAG: hypothetical protein DI535_20715 [Citrobacter freundii]
MKVSHQVRLPVKALQPFIRCYLDITMGEDDLTFHCSLPAKLEQCIFFSTGDIPVIRDDAKKENNILSADNCCHVRGGMNTTNLKLQIDGVLDMFVVIFQPSGFFRFFNIPADHFSDTFTASAISLGKDWEYLGHKVREARTTDQRKDLIEMHLLRMLYQQRINHDAIDQTILQVTADPSISVNTMAKLSYLSERQFRRKFIERTGLSPQAFSRISRIGLALKIKRYNPARSWRSVAFESGYTDQSHFRKEMKMLMGIDHPSNETDDQFVNVEGTNFKLLKPQNV